VIEFRCICGKRLTVDDALAAQPVQCPACKAAIRVPAPEDAVSGPEALQAAMRDIQRNPAADAPVAETVDTPVDLDEAAQGLDALAQKAGGPRRESGAAGRTSSRRAPRAAGSSRGRKPARSATRKARPPASDGQPGAAPRKRPAAGTKADAKRKQAMIVGGFAAAGLILIVVVLALALRDDTPPPPPKDETAAPVPAVEPDRHHGPYTGHQPGELFNHVPFDGEKDGAGDADDGS